MARLRRVVLPGQLHLIIQRAQSGQAAFLEPADLDIYLAALRVSAVEAKVAVHAYSLRASEIRLLVTPMTVTGLASMMQAVGRRYVRAFNQTHGRNGTPWEGRFRSTVVEAERDFVACLRFVEKPAEGAGLTANDAALRSSLSHHLGLEVDPMISEHTCFWAFGNTPFDREAAYKRVIAEALPADEEARISNATINGWVLGSLEFAARVSDASGRRSRPLARGRPRKHEVKD